MLSNIASIEIPELEESLIDWLNAQEPSLRMHEVIALLVPYLVVAEQLASAMIAVR